MVCVKRWSFVILSSTFFSYGRRCPNRHKRYARHFFLFFAGAAQGTVILCVYCIMAGLDDADFVDSFEGEMAGDDEGGGDAAVTHVPPLDDYRAFDAAGENASSFHTGSFALPRGDGATVAGGMDSGTSAARYRPSQRRSSAVLASRAAQRLQRRSSGDSGNAVNGISRRSSDASTGQRQPTGSPSPSAEHVDGAGVDFAVTSVLAPSGYRRFVGATVNLELAWTTLNIDMRGLAFKSHEVEREFLRFSLASRWRSVSIDVFLVIVFEVTMAVKMEWLAVVVESTEKNRGALYAEPLNACLLVIYYLLVVVVTAGRIWNVRCRNVRSYAEAYKYVQFHEWMLVGLMFRAGLAVAFVLERLCTSHLILLWAQAALSLVFGVRSKFAIQTISLTFVCAFVTFLNNMGDLTTPMVVSYFVIVVATAAASVSAEYFRRRKFVTVVQMALCLAVTERDRVVAAATCRALVPQGILDSLIRKETMTEAAKEVAFATTFFSGRASRWFLPSKRRDEQNREVLVPWVGPRPNPETTLETASVRTVDFSLKLETIIKGLGLTFLRTHGDMTTVAALSFQTGVSGVLACVIFSQRLREAFWRMLIPSTMRRDATFGRPENVTESEILNAEGYANDVLADVGAGVANGPSMVFVFSSSLCEQHFSPALRTSELLAMSAARNPTVLSRALSSTPNYHGDDGGPAPLPTKALVTISSARGGAPSRVPHGGVFLSRDAYNVLEDEVAMLSTCMEKKRRLHEANSLYYPSHSSGVVQVGLHCDILSDVHWEELTADGPGVAAPLPAGSYFSGSPRASMCLSSDSARAGAAATTVALLPDADMLMDLEWGVSRCRLRRKRYLSPREVLESGSIPWSGERAKRLRWRAMLREVGDALSQQRNQQSRRVVIADNDDDDLEGVSSQREGRSNAEAGSQRGRRVTARTDAGATLVPLGDHNGPSREYRIDSSDAGTMSECDATSSNGFFTIRAVRQWLVFTSHWQLKRALKTLAARTGIRGVGSPLSVFGRSLPHRNSMGEFIRIFKVLACVGYVPLWAAQQQRFLGAPAVDNGGKRVMKRTVEIVDGLPVAERPPTLLPRSAPACVVQVTTAIRHWLDAILWQLTLPSAFPSMRMEAVYVVRQDPFAGSFLRSTGIASFLQLTCQLTVLLGNKSLREAVLAGDVLPTASLALAFVAVALGMMLHAYRYRTWLLDGFALALPFVVANWTLSSARNFFHATSAPQLPGLLLAAVVVRRPRCRQAVLAIAMVGASDLLVAAYLWAARPSDNFPLNAEGKVDLDIKCELGAVPVVYLATFVAALLCVRHLIATECLQRLDFLHRHVQSRMVAATRFEIRLAVKLVEVSLSPSGASNLLMRMGQVCLGGRNDVVLGGIQFQENRRSLRALQEQHPLTEPMAGAIYVGLLDRFPQVPATKTAVRALFKQIQRFVSDVDGVVAKYSTLLLLPSAGDKIVIVGRTPFAVVKESRRGDALSALSKDRFKYLMAHMSLCAFDLAELLEFPNHSNPNRGSIARTSSGRRSKVASAAAGSPAVAAASGSTPPSLMDDFTLAGDPSGNALARGGGGGGCVDLNLNLTAVLHCDQLDLIVVGADHVTSRAMGRGISIATAVVHEVASIFPKCLAATQVFVDTLADIRERSTEGVFYRLAPIRAGFFTPSMPWKIKGVGVMRVAIHRRSHQMDESPIIDLAEYHGRLVGSAAGGAPWQPQQAATTTGTAAATAAVDGDDDDGIGARAVAPGETTAVPVVAERFASAQAAAAT